MPITPKPLKLEVTCKDCGMYLDAEWEKANAGVALDAVARTTAGGKMTDRNDWFAAIFITAFIFIVLGYAWGYSHQEMNYEAGYKAGIEEMSVVVKEEICR